MTSEGRSQPQAAPTVSVIVPVYERIGWAVEAVGSVLKGTFKDFEVILVDDGSTEDIAPLRRLEDGRVRYIRQENRGASAARNLGLEMARGRYVAFLDSDDVFESEKLERQVALMERHPDIDMSHTSYEVMDEKGSFLREVRAGGYSGQVYPAIYSDSHYIATPTVMVRRDVPERGVRFNESVRYGEDTLFWVECLKRSELLGIDEPLSKVRMHGASAISNPDAQLEGTISLTRHGLAKDKNLPFFQRRKMVSSRNIGVSQIYAQKQKRAEALSHAFTALFAWPFSRHTCRFVVALIYKSVRRNRSSED